MQNSNYARKICTVICALLCVGSLSGCSAALQSLADGTDDMLNGLADATDSVMNDLADGADQALSFLQGHREKGVDDYTGAYKATYTDFAGTELLFGGTTLKREAGNTIRINCSLSLESGEAAVFLCSGAEDPVILLSESGEYDDTVEVDGTSTYVGVWGDHADGTVSVEIE